MALTMQRRRNESGLPLGGIGAGKIEFCPDGRFTNITTNNNWDCPIVDSTAVTPPMPRIKEGFDGSIGENADRRHLLYRPEGTPGAWLAAYTELEGAHVLKTHARPSMRALSEESIEFNGRFPVATVHYPSFQSISLELSAFSSFVIPDFSEGYRDSALPLALFAFNVTNHSMAPLPVGLAMSWQNLNGVGGYAGHPINEPAGTPPRVRAHEGSTGLWFDHDSHSTADGRTLGNYSLIAHCTKANAVVSTYAGWNEHQNGADVWEHFAQTGSLSNGTGAGMAGAVAVTVTLEVGESISVVFALAWYMPRLLAAETAWTHLVRPSSAPPAPSSTHRRDYGHAYQRWFDDSWAVAAYGLTHWNSILQRIRAWQNHLAESSLPKRFVDALCNDLFPLYANTWYTRDLMYAVNESPTDMNGCLGTLDQRGVANAAVARFFPLLDRAELDLFAQDQIGDESDPRHFGYHFNLKNARFDLKLNRQGAILHDVGWDHLEGGRTGDWLWGSAHWPELTSLFVLQSYQYALWSGDMEWLKQRYPQFKEALRFQERLDQDNDGVADLWGVGSCTYDVELYPYFGAASYTTSLYLAALHVMVRLAETYDDTEFLEWTRQTINRASAVFEGELWDEELGYYISWRDNNHQAWDGLGDAHPRLCRDSQVSQNAGSQWAELLNLGEITDPVRKNRALTEISKRNVQGVSGVPADEYRTDGTFSQSIGGYVLGYYVSLAIQSGLPDLGWQAVENIYHVRYELDGSPWDAPLQWAGPHNELAQWGRWYMANPASWAVLGALSGVHIDRAKGWLWFAPNWPANWSDRLEALPVYLPGFAALLTAERGAERWMIEVRITELNNPVSLTTFGTRLPADLVKGGSVVASRDYTVDDAGHLLFQRHLRLSQPGDGFQITVELSHESSDWTASLKVFSTP